MERRDPCTHMYVRVASILEGHRQPRAPCVCGHIMHKRPLCSPCGCSRQLPPTGDDLAEAVLPWQCPAVFRF